MQYKDKCKLMEDRLAEVNELSMESQAELGNSTQVLRGLEDKLKQTQVQILLPYFMIDSRLCQFQTMGVFHS